MADNIRTHVYRTPTDRNPDAYSVGVLGLTREEAEIVAKFARDVRGWSKLRDREDMPTVRIPVRMPLTFAPPEPAPPLADRFSGLEL